MEIETKSDPPPQHHDHPHATAGLAAYRITLAEESLMSFLLAILIESRTLPDPHNSPCIPKLNRFSVKRVFTYAFLAVDTNIRGLVGGSRAGIRICVVTVLDGNWCDKQRNQRITRS